MAFWGVEIKPGTPYTHQYDETLGRLHIGQATLGSGSSSEKAKRVVVQCNVGNKSPVLICSLLPEKSEWCQLNLEFEEHEGVVFSVLGPKSVHLSGYYLRSQNNHDGDETDSYGEDIAETESDQSSDYDDLEEEYEDDFIDDDDDLGMFNASPRPNSGVKIVEIIEDEKPANENGTRKRLKKHQISDSDGDDGSQKQIVIKGSSTPVLESEDEDGFPISSMLKKYDQNTEVEEETDKKTTKKGKTREKKTKDESDQVTSFKRKVDAIDQNGDSAREADQLCDSSVPSSEVGAESGGKPKKKKKESAKKGKTLKDGVNSSISGTVKKSSGDQDQAFHGSESDVPIDNKAHTEGTQIDNMNHDLPVRDDPEEKLPNNKSIDAAADIQSETKKKNKKKKKKRKNNEIDSSADGEEPGQIDEDKKELVKENKAEERPSKTRTYPNGLVVEELSMGTPDGKRASAGKKVSVHYIGKLEKNGSIFDSNIGQRPFTFRLGIGQVIKGWDVGVEGMRVGDKRRLTIPPSMGYGSKGVGKIPGNATLVFDVELVDVK